jgi:hypothetical protein
LTAPPSPPAAALCPRCHATVPADARFCAGCGATIAADTGTNAGPNPGPNAGPNVGPPPPPPNNYPPPPPPPPNGYGPPQPPPGFTRGVSLGAGGGSAQATVNADPSTAFAQVIAALGGEKAQVMWQSPPQSAKFSWGLRDMWNTGGLKINYVGDVTVMPAGARQSTVRVDCKPESLSSLLGICIGGTLLGAMMFMRGGLGMIILIGGGVGTAWMVYNLSNGVPKVLAEKILSGLQMATYGNASGAGQPPHAPPPPPPPGQYAPPPPPPPNGSSAGTSSDIVERMKKLTQLRDMGALTADEFDAMKADLLKRF